MTDFGKYLEFPARFSFRVMGAADPQLPDRVVAAVQALVPGDYVPTHKPSSKGTYWAVAIEVMVADQAMADQLYQALGAVEGVRMVI